MDEAGLGQLGRVFPPRLFGLKEATEGYALRGPLKKEEEKQQAHGD